MKKVLRCCGCTMAPVRPKPAGTGTRTTLEESFAQIRRLGFQPKTVIDVGVARGTPGLYRTFPGSYFLLIEPLEQFESDLKSILLKYNGSYVMVAAGSRSGDVAFNVHENHLGGSSLYKESMGPQADGHALEVPMRRLDDLLRDKQLTGPYLMKIDVQGAELDVLEGAQEAMKETEVIALEVSMFEFMTGAPQFSQVIAYMKDHGFVAYDIVIGWNRPLDGALGQADVVFVKDNGMFRKNHSFAAAEQATAIMGH